MTTMTTQRKCQQDELYAAEEAATVPRGRVFTSLDEIQRYVDELRDTRWWHSLGYWTVLRVEVGKARAGGGSVGSYEKDKNAGRIEMAPVHWCELFVLHELSHVLAAALYDSKSHDPAFARTFLQLVYCMMGADAYDALKSSFDRNGINYNFRTTPEGRFAL